MLVLNRRTGEKVYIKTTDGLVSVTVVDRIRCQCSRTKLLFEAPESVQILRAELVDRDDGKGHLPARPLGTS